MHSLAMQSSQQSIVAFSKIILLLPETEHLGMLGEVFQPRDGQECGLREDACGLMAGIAKFPTWEWIS